MRNAIFAIVLFLIPVTVAVAGVALLRFPPGYETETSNEDQAALETTETSAPTSSTEAAASETTIAAPTNDPEEAPDEAAAPLEVATYRVQAGDSLSEIGTRFGVDWREIAELNDISDANLIFEGQVLRLAKPQSTTLTIGTDEFDESLFNNAAQASGVAPELLMAVAWISSEWDAALVGDAGQVGVGQLTPEVHEFVERDLVGGSLDAGDPSDSVVAMGAYLNWLLDQADGELSPALAAYREGLVTVRNIGWSNDTLVFVQRVTEARIEFVNASS